MTKDEMRALLKSVTTKTALQGFEREGKYAVFAAVHKTEGAGGIRRTKAPGQAQSWKSLVRSR